MMTRHNMSVALLLSVWSVGTLTGFTLDLGQKHFTNRDLRGSYTYSYEARFGEGLTRLAVEGGVFTADGKGAMEGKGTAMVDGQKLWEATYSCTYAVKPDGTVPVTCTRTTTQESVQVRILLLLRKNGREAQMIGLSHDPPFEEAQVIGWVARQ